MLSVASWRSIFWASALYGLFCMLLVHRTLPETLPRERRISLSPISMFSHTLELVRERSFISHAMVNAAGAFVTFTYLGAAPVVFIRLFGLTPPQFGMLFGVNAMAMISASQLNGPLVQRLRRPPGAERRHPGRDRRQPDAAACSACCTRPARCRCCCASCFALAPSA